VHEGFLAMSEQLRSRLTPLSGGNDSVLTEAPAVTAFEEGQLVAVRSAYAEELGHPVDWDDPASHRHGLEEEYEASAEQWSVSGVMAGVGCLVGPLRSLRSG
jgi:hypothetical protein